MLMLAATRTPIGLATALFATAMTIAAAPADAARLALVIGNDNYQYATSLQNARADAQAVARTLERAKFAVTLKQDLGLREFKEALRGFKSQLAGGDEAVFYFSGHGVQFQGTNYLIPTDLRPENAEQVADDAVPLQRVLDDLSDQRARFALAIVDACRDNPFKGTGRAIGARGLAPVTAATGQMILYSAGAGQEALDRLGPGDNDPNGVFTRVLIREMDKPGVPVDQMLRNVRDQVVRLARSVNHEQVPALYDQAIGEFYISPTDVAHGDVKLQAFTLLASTRNAQTREKIEQQLAERLRQSLPNNIFYSTAAHTSGWGFKPAAASGDGHTWTVTLTAGAFRDGRFAFDDSDVWDYRLDCASQQLVPVRHSSRGAVTYLAEASRKAGTLDLAAKPNQPEKLVQQVLCEAPLRITPLWAVQELEWTELGQGWRSALAVRWSDPRRPAERYVFSRHDLASSTWYGADAEFWWLAVNCATGETRDTPSFAASRSGEIIGMIAGTQWIHPAQGTPAANALVLLCERQ
jgi:Caspase domain